MLAIGRALMARPSCSCSTSRRSGWRRMIVKEIFNIDREINRAGTTVLLVEQNTRQALALLAPRLRARERPRGAGGHGRELLGNEHVRRAYLGL